MTTSALPLPQLVRGRFACSDGCDLPLYTDEVLYSATGVRIVFTTREGGVGEGPYSALNLAAHVNDDPTAVERNRAQLLDALGCPDALLVNPNQVHGDNVVHFVSTDQADIRARYDEARAAADAISVAVPDVAALLCYADCMPVIIVAPNGGFAVAHCGWRGVVSHIVRSCLDNLCQNGVSPAECNVYIGPYIHGECFEVGEEVAQTFEGEFGSEVVVHAAADNTPYPKPHVDLAAAVRVDLRNAGIEDARIADIDRCTVCNNQEFFSYRAQQGVCGRHAALAIRKER